jgi:hypothetical protein
MAGSGTKTSHAQVDAEQYWAKVRDNEAKLWHRVWKVGEDLPTDERIA